MKKYLWALALLLVLTGCAQNVEPDAVPATQETTIPPETSCYVKESSVEKATKGAVMLYDLPDGEYTWMCAGADRLTLVSWDGRLKLTQGSGSVSTFVLNDLPLDALQKDTYCQDTMVGAVFYDAADHKAIFIRAGLQQYVVDLPDFDGYPVFSNDGNYLYYCAAEEIRVTDLNTGIDRMLKSHTCKSQSLVGIHFDGAVLECRITGEDDRVTTAFISTKTGETLATESNLHRFISASDVFYTHRIDGTVEQQLAGKRGGQVQELLLPEEKSLMPMPELNGIVACSVGSDDTLSLDFYDLTTGKHTSSVKLQSAGAPKALCADKAQNSIWLLAKDPNTEDVALYQWMIEKTSVQDEKVYIRPYYNAENPDEEGLAKLAAQAKELADRHGVRIHIWKDAVANPGELTLEPEYQTQAIADCLEALKPVLEAYPAEFLANCAIQRLNISIVRNIAQEEPGVQYWQDGQAYIVLPVGCDYVQAFALGLGYVVDSHVLGNSSILDDWGSLNPSGFSYGETPSEEMLTGADRVFADGDCAASVTDDRARTFYYAICPGNEAVFESEIMQQKLLKLCRGIRAAWRWKKVKEVFPWEQYLNESIAPT